MTTFVPRPAYSEAELQNLYPENLELKLVQVLLRHGERSPVSPRFQNAGLRAYWPYCNAARRFTSAIMTTPDGSQWEPLHWKRKLERAADDDSPLLAAGSDGDAGGIWQYGELTDKGRQTSLALGQRLRHLYVNQLEYMPSRISSANGIYLRSTPLPRALESVQQAFQGLYPSMARSSIFQPPDIVTRTPADETLYPNDTSCRRFDEFCHAYAQRAADRWDNSDEIKYVNKKIGKWMPALSPKVAVGSHPRLSGVMDTINATLAHGPPTRLPSEFYDAQVRKTIEKVGVDEWYSGYNESREYRIVGIGGLAGDVVERMVEKAGDSSPGPIIGQEEPTSTKFTLCGTHDTTIAGLLSSLGAFNKEPWPPFTSHIVIELFKGKNPAPTSPITTNTPESTEPVPSAPSPIARKSWLSSLFTSPSPSSPSQPPSSPTSNPNRLPLTQMPLTHQTAVQNHYVRLRYNDRIMTIPGCRKLGNHLKGDESMCTLTAFKAIVDDFTPRNWKKACTDNLGQVTVRPVGGEEWGGYAAGEGPVG